MNGLVETAGLWLADVHLLAAALLGAVVVLLAALEQPARRMAVTRSTLGSLAALAALCALPGWSVVHLLSSDAEAPAPAVEARHVAPLSKQVKMMVVGPVEVTRPAIGDDKAGSAKPQAADGVWDRVRGASWASWAVGAQALGSALVLGWLGCGAVLAARVRRRAALASEELDRMLKQIAGSGRAPELLVSDQVETAAAMGIWRPRIVLAEGLLAATAAPLGDASHHGAWARSVLGSVLAHEWAHVRHGDLWTLAASRWLSVLFWPQPLFWILRRWMRLDQETLADSAAVEISGRVNYAEQLLGWARQAPSCRPRGLTPRLAGGVGLWEGPSQLKQRVAALLDERFTLLAECSRRWRIGAACLALAAAGVLSLLTLEPGRLVAQEAKDDQTPGAAAETKHSASTSSATATIVVAKQGDPFVPEAPYKANHLAYRILGEDGQPVAGAEVWLYRWAYRDGTHELIEKQKTSDAGEVEFADLVGTAQLAEFKKIHAERDFYGSSLQKMFLAAIRAEGRATVLVHQPQYAVAVYGARDEVTLPRGRELSGRVTDPAGKPVPGALVAAGSWASNLAIEGVNAVRTDREGRYVFKDRQPLDAAAARKREQETMLAATRVDVAAKRETPPRGTDLHASNVVVTHPDFAVAAKEGDDIPGTNDVQLAPAAAIVGRVVHAETGEPAANVLVRAANRPEPRTKGTGPTLFGPSHSASTHTDSAGQYRLSNLPAGSYDIWASTPADDMQSAEWVNRGFTGVKAVAGANPTAATVLTIGPAGAIRGQLVGPSGEPVKLAGEGPFLRAHYELVGGPSMQNLLTQRAALTADGKFEVHVPPGKLRVMILVYPNAKATPSDIAYRTDYDDLQSRPALEVGFGQTTEVKFNVRSHAELQERQNAQSKAWELLRENKHAEAAAIFTQVIARYPNNESALRGRWVRVYSQLGDDAAAAADWEAILAKSPDDVGAQLNLAMLLASSPVDAARNGRRAVELAERATEALRPTVGPEGLRSILATLAAAYAEAGDFEKAVATQQEVVALTPAEPAVNKASAEETLEQYQAGKPYRNDPVAPSAAAAALPPGASSGTFSLVAAAPAAAEPAAKPKPEKFVRIVVGQDGAMTFEGEKTTWEALPALLEKVADREKAVLEIAIDTDDLSVREANKAQWMGFRLAGHYKFLYGSYIGVHPLGSKGGAEPAR